MIKRTISDLDPKIVWRLFESISKIPRVSKKEDKIRTWVKRWANEKNITCKEDRVGNLLLTKEPSIGCENFPGIVLQGHLDMVAEKTSESTHNFDSDPIQTQIIDNYVTAEGTTLGADNGIGMAIALAMISDSTLIHGPIEVLLTIDEETGLTGAFGLEKGFFTHKLILNLDSENEGEITISSAGGGDTKIVIPISKKSLNDYNAFNLKISGLKGGHSGLDIHLPRVNAIKLLIEVLENISENVPIFIDNINGGSAHNAIPRECECIFLVHRNNTETIERIFAEWIIKIENLRINEPNVKIELSNSSNNEIMDLKPELIFYLLKKIPHGSLTYSKTITDLVETSNNLALIKTDMNSITIVCSTRSSVDEELNKVRKQLSDLGKEVGADVSHGSSYPGWEPELESPFLKLVHQEYEREYEKHVELKAIHAGLECGLFKGLDSDLHIVSLGPEIKDAHSPKEKVYIDSVVLIWRVVRSVIGKLGQIKI